MEEKVLVAFATRQGNTAEAAEHIGNVIAENGLDVEVKSAADVINLNGYKAVVLGTPIKGDKLLPEAMAFAERFRKELDRLPTAFFGLTMTMSVPTDENKRNTLAILNQLRFEMRPIGMGAFGGVRDENALPSILKWTAKRSKIPTGDFRDWDAMREWATRVATLIKEDRRY